MRRIYVDHNATTPLAPEVVAAMTQVLRDHFGNPSSLHWYGQRARALVEEARASVARLVGASAAEIVFTGSGTEADNMALRGACAAAAGRRRLLFAAIEHHAVIHCARGLAEDGWTAEPIRVATSGCVDLDHLAQLVDEHTAVVAVMLANNETGVIQPVAAVAQLAHAHGALVLCDAVQAAGKIPVDVKALDADLVALSAHKLCGPKGVGALWVRRGARLKPFLRGGAQERNRRAGTENVAGIVGFGQAARLALDRLPQEMVHTRTLRDSLERALLAIAGTDINGQEPRVPNTSNVSFDETEAESLVMALDLAGVAAASGAACASGAVEPSHVLRAMGLPPRRVASALRLSLGHDNTEADVVEVAAAVAQAVEQQRRRRAPSR